MTKKTPDSFYRRKIKPLLPVKAVYLLADLKKKIREKNRTVWRISNQGTKLLGRQYDRSQSLMEIDLTYACNLACNHCNRSCPQAPSDERITLEQIKKMVSESIAKGIIWQRMRLLGGEPTLNPELYEIVKELNNYKKGFSKNLQIILVTNGIAQASRELAVKLKADFNIIIEDSSKQPLRQLDFIAFNQAPLDDAKFKETNYSNGCHVLKDCGLGFTPYGFYPCAIAGGIDRVLGLDIARKEVPDKNDKMVDQLLDLCSWCGHFKMNYGSAKNQGASVSWQEKYEEYKKKAPVLGKY
jgi:hypothetical protein